MTERLGFLKSPSYIPKFSLLQEPAKLRGQFTGAIRKKKNIANYKQIKMFKYDLATVLGALAQHLNKAYEQKSWSYFWKLYFLFKTQ